MNATLLEVQDADVGYGRPPRRGRVVLRGVCAELRVGELACLIGPNGTGKSTLLRSVARFQPLLGGSVRVAGRPIAAVSARDLARQVAVVLTDRVIVGAMRVYDVVALGRFPHTGVGGRLHRHDHAVVQRSMLATGATQLADRLVAELSDGERQRVMIARALAQEPSVLLLDEPAAFLDVRGRFELTALLLRLTREHGLAVLMSTHDLEHTLRNADTVWLVDGERVLVAGPEDLVLAGHVERTLSGNVTLDPRTGALSAPVRRCGLVHVVADGDAGLWAARAIERAGWGAGGPNNGATIRADAVLRHVPGEASGMWRLEAGGTSTATMRLSDVVDRLRDLGSPSP